jgi:hypothetical protein
VFLSEHAHNPEIVAALLNAPDFLSGMNEVEMEYLRALSLRALHPKRAAAIDLLERTSEGLRRARANAERMLVARTGVKRDREGKWRVAEPAPGAGVLPRGVGTPSVPALIEAHHARRKAQRA